MSGELAQTPRQLLEQQIAELGGLRNAGNRSPLFRQWRQNTLTVIQRVWPGDPSRSERFRRIPFSAPSSKATMRDMRECYERGCAEAAAFLHQLRDEIGDVSFRDIDVRIGPHDAGPGTAEDDFPTLELPHEGGSTAPAGPVAPSADGRPVPGIPAPPPPPVAPPAVRPAGASRELDLPPAPAAPVTPPKLIEPGRSTPPDEPAEAAAPPPSGRRTRPAKMIRKSGKGRLKDMLGFDDPRFATGAAERAAEQRAAQQRAADQRVAEKLTAAKRAAEQRAAEQRAASSAPPRSGPPRRSRA